MSTLNFKGSAVRLILQASLFASMAMGSSQALSSGNGDLRVMTYNVDEGTDFLEVQQARTTSEFLIAVGQTITQLRATQPRKRMKAIARQIIDAAPTLVSLQEMDQWSSGPFDPVTSSCGPMTIEFDMVQDLLDALAAQGAHYAIAIRQQQFAIPPVPGLIPSSSFLCASVVNNVVLLARTDLEPARFQWSNPQSGTYQATLYFPTPLGTLLLPRAWVSVDATFHGKAFRFIGTHLEFADLGLRRLQGVELRVGPGSTQLPVIVAMDSNAQAEPLPLDPAYVDFIGAGYQDAWAERDQTVAGDHDAWAERDQTVAGDHHAWAERAHSAAGFTCCQAQLLNNVESQLTQRIDLILTKGPIKVQNVALFGADSPSKTSTGLWPSDHAGVAAQLEISESRSSR